MKTRTKRILIVVGAIVGALVVLRIGLAFVWPTINDVRTGATAEYPDLQPQRFSKPFDQVFAAALATAREMEFEITSQSPEKGEIQAIATTRVFRFKDDVTITVGRDGLVNVHSRSRIGKGDLGANARRIRDFQAGLARRL
ncbi:MAG TPA: DUF1499 domain-containing protein [Burkholderiales bacterium]|nr:DUF1499 domain-containing protein [Burkholderiales bacterium]